MEPLACSNQSFSGLLLAGEPTPHLITPPVYSSGKRVHVFKNPSQEELDHVVHLDKLSKIQSAVGSGSRSYGPEEDFSWVRGAARGSISHNGNVFI